MNKKKSETKSLEIIKKIPDTNKYENTKIVKQSNWFNKNMAIVILILFVIIGITIILLIAK